MKRFLFARLPSYNENEIPTAKGSILMPYKSLIVIFVATTTIAGNAAADTYGSAERTSEHTITSKQLGEEREIYIRTPPNYVRGDNAYPVVYVLDGEWNFEFVASYLDYMFDNEVYPEMIVTGVKNVNRNRDYVPQKDAYFDDTGEADKFLGFVTDEWIEYVDMEFSTSGERVLIGHSFGGVFTLHTLFREPEQFDAYIALGSSAWIADQVLFNEATAFFEGVKNTEAFVYMAVGEGDGGPTVPSSTDLAALFEEKAPASLEWTFRITPKADHFKNFAAGLHDAFMALFPAWNFEEEVRAHGESRGAAGVNAWFYKKRAALGFRFKPAWFDMGVTAIALSQNDKGEAALALMAQLRTYYPGNPHVAAFSASVFENLEQFAHAEQEILRAIAIANKRKLHPNEIHIDQLKRRLDGVRDAQNN